MEHGTSSKRLTRALESLKQWLVENMHEPIREQWKTLRSKVQGHYNYDGVVGNSHAPVGLCIVASTKTIFGQRSCAGSLPWASLQLSGAKKMAGKKTKHPV